MLKAKSGPWSPFGCKDILPYSLPPMYSYLLIADTVSPTTVLRGCTWDWFLAAGNCSLHQTPSPSSGAQHCLREGSFQNLQWGETSLECPQSKLEQPALGRSRQAEGISEKMRWLLFQMDGHLREGNRQDIYKVKSSFRRRNELLMAMENLSTRHSSLMCADKR